MTITYNQLGDLSDAQFERIWNNPGTVLVWDNSVEKRGKSALRHSLYTQCSTPKQMRNLYQEQQAKGIDAFKNVKAKEEFKWDFKRGNVVVNVPQQSQSPFFVRAPTTKNTPTPSWIESSVETEEEKLTQPTPQEVDQPFSDDNQQNEDSDAYVLASPVKPSQEERSRKSITFPKTPVKTSQVQSQEALRKRPKVSSKLSYPLPSDSILSQQPQESNQPPVSPAKTLSLSQGSPLPKSPIPFHIRQRMKESEHASVIKAVPLSYNLSWLQQSNTASTAAKTNASPNKRSWLSTL